ncbi:hypothetical protein ACFQ9X_37285 [Catenulispora yoronensis]
MECLLLEIGGWRTEQVTVLGNGISVVEAVKCLHARAKEAKDAFLLYYVGHGVISGTKRHELCLTLSGTDYEHPEISAIAYSHIREVFADCAARVKISILDCCFSGRAIEALSSGSLNDLAVAQGVYTLSASDGYQTAHVPQVAAQPDVCTSFTAQLADLLRTGIEGGADVLTLGAIYPVLRARLLDRGLPQPNSRATDTAEQFPFAHNARAVAAPPPVASQAALPDEWKGRTQIPGWLRKFAEPALPRSTRRVAFDTLNNLPAHRPTRTSPPLLDAQVDLAQFTDMLGLSRRAASALAARADIKRAFASGYKQDLESVLRDLARDGVELPFRLPLLWRSLPAAKPARLEVSRVHDGFFMHVWRAEAGRICVLYPCDELTPRAPDHSRLVSDLDPVLIASESKKHGLYGPRLLCVDAEDAGRSYLADWRELARILGQDVPWWPQAMRRPQHMARWVPGAEAAVYETATEEDVAALLDLADSEPPESPARLAALALAANWRYHAVIGADSQFRTVGRARRPTGMTMAARPIKRGYDAYRDVPEEVLRVGWARILDRDDHLAWVCARQASVMYGGDVFPYGGAFSVSRPEAPAAAEWIRRLVATTPTAAAAYFGESQITEVFTDPVTGLPVVAKPNNYLEATSPIAYHGFAARRLPTTSPLAELVLDEVIWIRTQDGVLYPAPRRPDTQLGFGYDGTGSLALAILIDKLLDDIGAEAPDVMQDSASIGLQHGLYGHWPAGAVLGRTQLLLARQSTGRMDRAL